MCLKPASSVTYLVGQLIEVAGLGICSIIEISFDLHSGYHLLHLLGSFDYFHLKQELAKEIDLNFIRQVRYQTELLVWAEEEVAGSDSVADFTACSSSSGTSHTDSSEANCFINVRLDLGFRRDCQVISFVGSTGSLMVRVNYPSKISCHISRCMVLSDTTDQVRFDCRTSTAFDLTSHPFHEVITRVPFVIDTFLGYAGHLDCDGALYHHHVAANGISEKSCLERYPFSFRLTNLTSAASHEGMAASLLHCSYLFLFSYWEEACLKVKACYSWCSPKTSQLIKDEKLRC